MGTSSSFLRSVPSDYSRCSDEQLQGVIAAAIIRQPWYEQDEAAEMFAKARGLNEVDHRKNLESIDNLVSNITPFTTDVGFASAEKAKTLQEFLLLSTIEQMRIRGYRPISVDEYRNHLLRVRDNGRRSKFPPIKLWRKHNDTQVSQETKLCNVVYDEEEGHYIRIEDRQSPNLELEIVLPSSKEALTDEYEQLIEDVKSNHSAGVLKTQFSNQIDNTLSQCETEEWPSANKMKK